MICALSTTVINVDKAGPRSSLRRAKPLASLKKIIQKFCALAFSLQEIAQEPTAPKWSRTSHALSANAVLDSNNKNVVITVKREHFIVIPYRAVSGKRKLRESYHDPPRMQRTFGEPDLACKWASRPVGSYREVQWAAGNW
jgi:hypothetical protein